MILALYETDYPCSTTIVPQWEDLSIGYFNTGNKRPAGKTPIELYGRYYVADPKSGFRPDVGAHLLVVFVLGGETQSWAGTICYTWSPRHLSRSTWERGLVLHEQMKSC